MDQLFRGLTSQHRFKNDPKFGRVMKQIHEGCPTPEDIAYLNTRIINGDHPNAPQMADVPNNIAYAIYRNLDRVAINNGIFAEHIKGTHSNDKTVAVPVHTLIVRYDKMFWKTNQKPISASAWHTIWSECKDTDVPTGSKNKKFVDPFLKLYSGIPLMFMENMDVPNGEANGTLCHLVNVNLHKETTEDDFELMNIDGLWVRTIDASIIDYLLHGPSQLSHVRRGFVGGRPPFACCTPLQGLGAAGDCLLGRIARRGGLEAPALGRSRAIGLGAGAVAIAVHASVARRCSTWMAA